MGTAYESVNQGDAMFLRGYLRSHNIGILSGECVFDMIPIRVCTILSYLLE